jgi:hypothetical protein
MILPVVLICPSAPLFALEVAEEGKNPVVTPDRVSQRIEIDGELSEEAWKLPPLTKEFKTMMPNYGDTLSQKTDVWAAYDSENLYFAFKSHDTEPDKIKTSLSPRDNIARDDLIGVLLDALGNKQTNYEFYCNPNGIQWDAITSAVSGSDQSPDFVWDSAGKVTGDGYQVEIRIPLQSIRYQGGKEARMGVIFVRQISRLGSLGTWPALHPGQTDFNFMATIVYNNLKGELNLEVLPNFTFSRNSDRSASQSWVRENDTNFGIGVKYGISSSMTAEATWNPDFSQVESDTFQVEVNRRYPIFFNEKRPFFMESRDVLDFGVIHEGMMISPIHTRFIVDPGWALKFSGSAGQLNFTMLAANDRAPGSEWGGGLNPNEGKSALFGIVRAKYNIGSDNSIGVLYTGRHFAGELNNVGGIDLKYRLFKNLRFSISYLQSSSRYAEGMPLRNGGGLNAMLEYNKTNLFLLAAYERYDTDFYMATAFQNRTGISRGWFRIMPRFNMKIKNLDWLKRVAPYVIYSRLHDLGTGMDDTARILGLNLGFAPLGEVSIEYHDEDEAWAGIPFKKKYLFGAGFIQLFKWLNLTGTFMLGDQILYESAEPFVGKSNTVDLGFVIEPGMNLKVGFSYTYSDFFEKTQNQEIYSVNIYNFHTTYQFNKYFFMRGILRYDSYQDKLLTDLLASFTLIPGTVVHLGYGSLHMRNQWQTDHWVPGAGNLTQMRQGLFFKASYLLRIK